MWGVAFNACVVFFFFPKEHFKKAILGHSALFVLLQNLKQKAAAQRPTQSILP
jgi:hypothetical protein